MKSKQDASLDPMRAGAKLPHTRPPMRRMLYIHERLKRGKVTNCRKLGEEMEVNWRTAHRDIQFMQLQLQLPIEYDPRRRGYYYTKPVEQFPGVALSERELFALLVAQKAMQQYGGTPFEKPLRAAFDKLTSDLSQKDVFHVRDLGHAIYLRMPGVEEPDEESFQIAARAVHHHRPLKFRYRKLAKTDFEPRALEPYNLVCANQRWYVIGRDPLRQAIRAFALSRMQELEIAEGTFTRPADFRVEDHLRGSFGIFKGEHDFEVVILLDRWATDVMRGRRWHVSQQVDELPRGETRITFRLDNLEEIEPWVLSWGAHATVLSPRVLADRVLAAAKAMQERYLPPAPPGTSGRQRHLPLRPR